MHVKWAGVVLVVLTVAGVVAVRESGQSRSGTRSADVHAREATERRVAPKAQKRAKGVQVTPACVAASVSLGPDPGSIDFEVKCEPANSPAEGRFVVTRFRFDRRQGPSGIRMVQAGPRIVRPIAGQARGSCLLRRENILCSVRQGIRFRVRGRFWVEPGERCTMGVAIYVVEPPECPGGACRLPFDRRYLTRGHPRGCTQ